MVHFGGLGFGAVSPDLRRYGIDRADLSKEKPLTPNQFPLS